LYSATVKAKQQMIRRYEGRPSGKTIARDFAQPILSAVILFSLAGRTETFPFPFG
jgi:hypothetical protein